MQQDIDFNTIHTFTLDDHLVLLREEGSRILILNPLAKYIWHACEGGANSTAIANEVSQAFNIPSTLALQDVNAVIAQWSIDLSETDAKREEEHSKPQPPNLKDGFLDNWQPQTESTYVFSHFTLRVRFDSQKTANLLGSILGLEETSSPDNINHSIDVVAHNNSVLIVNDGEIEEIADTEEYAAVLTFREITKLHCSQKGWLAVLHAAGVTWQNNGIVLPATSGSGKTTLAAALLHYGFPYINDDVIPIERDTHQLIPLPVSLCIKSGSWEPLATLYPELEKLCSYGRFNAAVKYLPPPKHDSDKSTHQARYLIAPRYQHDATHHLQKISVAEGLQAIIEGSCQLNQPLKPDEIGEIIAWISKLQCYRLSYNNLDAAVETITKLVSTQA